MHELDILVVLGSIILYVKIHPVYSRVKFSAIACVWGT